ncbi:hypothetical protein [Algoriphagus limi]|uniref:tRNA 2-selenouridine synthase AAA domain-containing protein n=1 Tax=Algoriphagus limi TaxID=2975273 RepID=A0ABT2G7I0_9BACT|nr:hypothetical protein [Algoriphagus limi]MCS5490416.1 hypothetical protein [Algoriphagus limi]
MVRIQSIQNKFLSNKPILLFDEGKGFIAQAIWQHYQPTQQVFIYRNGITGLLQEAEEVFKRKLKYVTLYGKTGVGKSALLEFLRSKNQQVLHLEELANHKGSTFGNLEHKTQLSQESFILQLAEQVAHFDPNRPVFVESEKYSLGKNLIPLSLLENFSNGKRVQLSLYRKNRIERLIKDYAGINDKEIEAGIEKLKFRIGSKKAEDLKRQLSRKNYEFVMEGLLDYFDKSDSYQKNETLSFDLIQNAEDLEKAGLDLIERFS